MKWALKLGEVAGIGVFVHWTFSLLLIWVAFVHMRSGGDLSGLSVSILLVLALFGCVVLHELGHALTARRYGIKTRDITLLPIGGVARLERMPDDPTQEFWVAIAGPAVNVVIVMAIFAVLLVLQLPVSVDEVSGDLLSVSSVGAFLIMLMAVNIFMVLFNLLPAFPMDGGRVLRSILAQRMNYVRATQIAATVGQFMALLFGLVGLMGQQPFLILIAFFVYMGAQEESHMVQMRSILRGVPVREAMMTRFRVLTEHDSLAAAISELLAGSQQDFPVQRDGEVIGILPRKRLFEALHAGQQHLSVKDVMETGCEAVHDYERLDETFQRMREKNCSMLPVMRNGQLVGLVTLENVGEWMMIQTALRQTTPPAGVSDALAQARE